MSVFSYISKSVQNYHATSCFNLILLEYKKNTENI